MFRWRSSTSISRYCGGPPEAAPLHKLGGDTWDKAKRRAARAVRDTAAELLHLYAQRATRQGRTFGVSQHDVDAFAEGFGFEETRGPGCGDRRRDRGHAHGQTDGPADLRRRRLRQDRGRAARRVRRRGRQHAGRGAHAHHAARRAAFPDLLGPLCRLAGQNRRALALSHRQGNRRRAERARHGRDRHRHRHAQAAFARREVRAARPGDRRRGAPLRRAPEGGAEGAARGGRRAHAHRDADSAHARDVAGGPARPFGDRHRARSGAWRSRPSSRPTRPASSARPACAS